MDILLDALGLGLGRTFLGEGDQEIGEIVVYTENKEILGHDGLSV